MGRVLLARMPEDARRQVLEKSERKRFTHRTLVDIENLMDKNATAGCQGYVLIDEELEAGLVAVAVPIVNRRCGCVGALNTYGHASQTSIDTLRVRCLPAALDATKKLYKVLP